MAKSVKKHSLKKTLAAAAIAVILAVGIYFLVAHYDKKSNNLYTPTASSSSSTPKKITATTSQPTPLQSQTSSNLVAGGVKDENGQSVSNLPPSSDWASSTNGQITLQEPNNVSALSSGDTITGTANVSQVSFILTDNSVGLIDQGNLSVVNGRFTGRLAFTDHSSSGKLEVYYPNPANGAEEDVVEIDVNFGS